MKKQMLCCMMLAAFISMISVSCKDKTTGKSAPDAEGTYFSIKQFVMDEWSTFEGTPFVITKINKTNGKKDSSFTNSDTLAWAPIIETFFKADIGDKKYVGKYEFSQSDDNMSNTHSFYYQALDDDLFTQKLLIVIDISTRKIVGIYIETQKSSFWDDCTQKLYYEPMKKIQIQTYDKPLLGSKKETITEYNFMI